MNAKYCVLQDDLKDCGVCCLLSIIKYYHGDISREYLKEITKTDKNGVNALNLLKSAREIGFEAYGLKGKLKDLKNKPLPLIAHIMIDKKFGHFIVIYKIDMKRNKIIAMDPAKGFISLSYTSFMELSTNYFLLLKPKHVIPKLVDKTNFIEKFKAFFIKHRTVLGILIFMSFIYTILNIIGSYHFKLLLDEALISTDNDLQKVFLLLLLLILFKYFVNLFRNYLTNALNYLLDKWLVQNAYCHIIHLPYLYYKNHTNGDFITRINDLGNVKELISNFFVSFFIDVFLSIFIVIIMLKINISLTIVSVISILIYSFIVFLFQFSIKNRIRETYQKSSEVHNTLMEGISSFETVKNLSIEDYVCQRFSNKYSEYQFINKSLLKVINNEAFFKNSVLEIGNLIIIFRNISLYQNNILTITSLITFTTLAGYFTNAIKNFLDLQFVYQNTKESLRRIKEVYAIPPEKVFNDQKKKIKKVLGSIDIDNVSYSYNGIDKVINNTSFSIFEGEKVLIYGNSGCGKSTLMQLLTKYLDNSYEGNITIGGYDLKDLSIATIRENICYASQNEYMYTDTIYENITLGRKVRYEDFLGLVKNLFIDEIVQNSALKYDYMLEKNGENLSGGEKSRIIIARLMLKKANIYIFDETFGTLDIEMERRILKYLFDKYQDKTFLVISHRASNLDLYHKKILMEGINGNEQ